MPRRGRGRQGARAGSLQGLDGNAMPTSTALQRLIESSQWLPLCGRYMHSVGEIEAEAVQTQCLAYRVRLLE